MRIYQVIQALTGACLQGSKHEKQIIGNAADPQEQRSIESLAREKRFDLKVITMVSDQQLVEYYNRALLLVYAPHLKPFGFAVLESMACGTPVVAVKEGGIRESVLDGYTGLRVRETSPSLPGWGPSCYLIQKLISAGAQDALRRSKPTGPSAMRGKES